MSLAQVRLEYHHYEDAAFFKGRLAVMRTFGQTPRLYFTGAMRDLLETRARENIANEIARLEAAVGS